MAEASLPATASILFWLWYIRFASFVIDFKSLNPTANKVRPFVKSVVRFNPGQQISLAASPELPQCYYVNFPAMIGNILILRCYALKSIYLPNREDQNAALLHHYDGISDELLAAASGARPVHWTASFK